VRWRRKSEEPSEHEEPKEPKEPREPEGLTGIGIGIIGGRDNFVENCFVSGDWDVGIEVRDSERARVSGNVVIRDLERAGSWAKRNPGWLAAAVAAATVIAGGIITLLFTVF
jgi:parallel beta-helix repeat protein